jgi:hypothetical protein
MKRMAAMLILGALAVGLTGCDELEDLDIRLGGFLPGGYYSDYYYEPAYYDSYYVEEVVVYDPGYYAYDYYWFP